MSQETDDNDVLSWLERRKKKNKNRYDMKYIHEHVTCFNETQSKGYIRRYICTVNKKHWGICHESKAIKPDAIAKTDIYFCSVISY